MLCSCSFPSQMHPAVQDPEGASRAQQEHAGGKEPFSLPYSVEHFWFLILSCVMSDTGTVLRAGPEINLLLLLSVLLSGSSPASFCASSGCICHGRTVSIASPS